MDFVSPMKLELESLNIHNLLDDVLTLVELDLSKQNIKLEKEYNQEEIKLKVDVKQFKQAILNIVLNAIDAMSEGGELKVTTQKEAEKIKITIADTGIGIPKNQIAHIFDAFYSGKDMGTGRPIHYLQHH